MLSATTGHNTTRSGRRYAISMVEMELLATGDGTVSGTVDYAPGLILLEKLLIKDESGDTLGTCTSAGVISGTGITGTITAAGVYSVTFSALGSDSAYITYYYQTDLPEDANGNKIGVPEANFEITSSSITAVDFPIRAKYSVIAALDMQKAHNVNLESEVTTHLANEIRFTIDQTGLDMIDEAAAGSGAATAITTWNAKIQSGQEWVWKIREFLDRLEEGSKNITEKTLRANATFIAAGNNVCRVIRQMGSDVWKPGANNRKLTGPSKIGVLDGFDVIQNPFKSNTNAFTMGYKGTGYADAGFIVSPYIPLYTTPTLTTSDLMSQKGFFSSVGFKTINAGMYTQGLVSNVGTIVSA